MAWPLSVGVEYGLIASTSDNGTFWQELFYPIVSGALVVDNLLSCGNPNYANYWFNFSNLVTCE